MIRYYQLSVRQLKELARGKVLHIAIPIDPAADEGLYHDSDHALEYARAKLPSVRPDVRRVYESYVWCSSSRSNNSEVETLIAPIGAPPPPPGKARVQLYSVNVVVAVLCRHRLRSADDDPTVEQRCQWPGGPVAWED